MRCPHCGAHDIAFIEDQAPRVIQQLEVKDIVLTREEHRAYAIGVRRASERLWTVIGACALQGRSAFEFILHAVQAFFQDNPPPSLLPAPP